MPGTSAPAVMAGTFYLRNAGKNLVASSAPILPEDRSHHQPTAAARGSARLSRNSSSSELPSIWQISGRRILSTSCAGSLQCRCC